MATVGHKHPADGLNIYLEAAAGDAATTCHNRHALHMANCCEHARAVPIGHTNAPTSRDYPKQGSCRRTATSQPADRL